MQRRRAFDTSCTRARARYAAAVLLVLAAGCEERERWPALERERPHQPRFAHSADLDCPHGDFCSVANAAPSQPAPSPFTDCEASAEIPADVATKTDPDRRGLLRVRFDEGRTKQARVGGQASACCYFWYEHCHGRPILVRGRPVLPRCSTGRREGAPSALESRLAGIDRTRRARIARSFRRDAAFEHASVRSFQLFAEDLERLGAPRQLVLAARRAANDEARHARLTFAFASAFAGRLIAPRSMSRIERTPPSLESFAASTYAEGCVAETIAAALVREAAARASDREVRRGLEGIARDEARHAELGWRAVAWARARGGRRVGEALEHEAARIAGAWAEAPRVRAERCGADEAFGVLDDFSRRAFAARAFDRVVRPCTELLLRG